MTKSGSVTITASLLLLVCFAGSVSLVRQVDKARPRATLEEVLYISSPKVLKRMSLGYDGLMADIYWTRAVQYFGRGLALSSTRFDLLAPLLEITTTLDPKLLVAYQFGGNFLSPPPPLGANMPEKAIQLINYGIQHNPGESKLYYQLGFVYYDQHDYRSAHEAFDKGSALPGAHPFMKILAAQMAQNAGDIKTARLLWLTSYETIPSKEIRENALAHLRALQVDEQITYIENAVTAYGRKVGNLPPSMAALARAGFLPGIPLDPDGHPYELTTDGRVLINEPDNFPFISRGLPPGYIPVPPGKRLEKLVQNYGIERARGPE
jgi:tetratricopeptide (TPR) repeat protein